MELKLGVMTNRELAAWFGIKEDTFKHSKKKKLNELKMFADFEEIKGKVNITNVKRSEYKKAADLAKDEFKSYWLENGIDTCARAALPLSEDTGVSLATAAEYVRKARDYYYGSPMIKKQKTGVLGCCRFIWTKVVKGEDFRFEPVSGEKLQEIEKIYKEVMGDMMLKDMCIKEAVRNKLISKDELWRMYEDDVDKDDEGRYVLFLDTVKARLGIDIAKATILLNKGQDAIKIEDGSTILTITDDGNIKVEEKNRLIAF